MIALLSDDKMPLLEAITRDSLRRRRRPTVEGQAARCPLCNRVMYVCMKRTGPGFICGCPEPAHDNHRPNGAA